MSNDPWDASGQRVPMPPQDVRGYVRDAQERMRELMQHMDAHLTHLEEMTGEIIALLRQVLPLQRENGRHDA